MTDKEFEQYQPLALAAMGKARKKYCRHVPLEDCRQAAYLAVVRAMPRFDPRRGALSSYLYSVVYRALQDLEVEYRAIHIPRSCWRRGKNTDKGEAAKLPSRSILPGDLVTYDSFEGIEARLDSERVLGWLSPREYQVITALYGLRGEGKTEVEYAEEEGVSRQAISQVRLRALQRMRVQARLMEKQLRHRG